MTFSQVMVACMDELGMRPAELADKSGVGRPYISQLIKGKLVDPSWSKARAIIAALGMTPEEFAALQDSDE